MPPHPRSRMVATIDICSIALWSDLGHASTPSKHSHTSRRTSELAGSLRCRAPTVSFIEIAVLGGQRVRTQLPIDSVMRGRQLQRAEVAWDAEHFKRVERMGAVML